MKVATVCTGIGSPEKVRFRIAIRDTRAMAIATNIIRDSRSTGIHYK